MNNIREEPRDNIKGNEEDILVPLILNNRLKWDGSYLGSYIGAITHQWSLAGTNYYGITLPQGWSNEHPEGIIYCTVNCTNDLFPCIVEDIKKIFGIPRRGIHRITIDNKEYILYYIPISIKGEVIWETPLNRLDNKHPLRRNPNFRKEVQKIIAFCDILALSSTGEPNIRIRPSTDGEYIPISVNESTTTIYKSDTYDYSILTKSLFTKWFGEETSINDIVKEMVHYQSNHSLNVKIPKIQGIELMNDNLAIISAEIRNKVDEIIKRYDNNYIWYSCFIIDRMSRHLLIDT
jgi:hypothetical protein